MGRDLTRIAGCAVVAVVLIVAATLLMDWYRLSPENPVRGDSSVAINLRHVHICAGLHACSSAPLHTLPGMYPAMATTALWSSLGVVLLLLIQAGARLLTGSGVEALTRIGYLFVLSTIGTVVTAVYLFGPETEDPGLGIIAELGGGTLLRTWAPITLIVGLIASLVAMHLAVAPASADLGAGYKPITLPPQANADPLAPPTEGALPGGSASGVPGEPRPAMPVMRRAATESGSHEPGAPGPGGRGRPASGQHTPVRRPATESGQGEGRSRSRPATAQLDVITAGTATAAHAASTAHAAHGHGEASSGGPSYQRARTATGQLVPPRAAAEPSYARARTATSQLAALGRPPSDPGSPRLRTATGQLAPVAERAKSGPLTPIPDHLRRRISYIALTAELTGGGVDARREDGTSRLVLWRDVVGVVARRLPPAFDGTPFVDIVSTAGSTLRIVPWTRLTGEPIEGEVDDRPRSLVARVIAICPRAKLDPATRHFLDTGDAAQIPDLEALSAHDAHLA